MRRIAIPLIGCLAVAGCMVGPDYFRPKIDTPDAFRYEETFAQETVNTEWWKAFNDPVLDRLIAEALANNRDVKIAAANIEQAVGALIRTRAPLFPQAAYNASAARVRVSEAMIPNKKKKDDPPPPVAHCVPPSAPKAPNPTNVFTVFAGASWEIDLWGRIRRLAESARANILASEEARRGVILSVVATVAGQYLQLRGLDEQLAIARSSRDAYAESVRIFELQFQFGLISRMVVEQARVQYETAVATIPQIESQIVQLENSLSILLGRNPGPIERGKAIHELGFPTVPKGLPSQLLERRPDLLQAEQNLISANALIGAAKARYFPTITLTGSYGSESSELSRLFTGPAQIWSYAGMVTGPIFTGGAIYGQVKEAKAGREAALQEYQSAIQNAFADVENALILRRNTTEQIQAQERLVTASREYERLARLQYDEGYTPYLTVLHAQEQRFPGELTLAQLRASVLASYVNLYKAMGGGWVAAAEEMTAGAAGDRGKR